jgi:hypothetical protein
MRYVDEQDGHWHCLYSAVHGGQREEEERKKKEKDKQPQTWVGMHEWPNAANHTPRSLCRLPTATATAATATASATATVTAIAAAAAAVTAAAAPGADRAALVAALDDFDLRCRHHAVFGELQSAATEDDCVAILKRVPKRGQLPLFDEVRTNQIVANLAVQGLFALLVNLVKECKIDVCHGRFRIQPGGPGCLLTEVVLAGVPPPLSAAGLDLTQDADVVDKFNTIFFRDPYCASASDLVKSKRLAESAPYTRHRYDVSSWSNFETGSNETRRADVERYADWVVSTAHLTTDNDPELRRASEHGRILQWLVVDKGLPVPPLT